MNIMIIEFLTTNLFVLGNGCTVGLNYYKGGQVANITSMPIPATSEQSCYNQCFYHGEDFHRKHSLVQAKGALDVAAEPANSNTLNRQHV